MTLGFSTKWPKQMGELAGQPNWFVEKILKSLPFPGWHQIISEQTMPDKVNDFALICLEPKLHTIRTGNRWKAGMKIHPVINNRTKNRFQFAPILECKNVQEMIIEYDNEKPNVYVDKQLFFWHTRMNSFGHENMLTLAKNDGFPSVEAFFEYFNQDFKGQIIHWTDLKY
jgi:hypothetical protein